MANIGAPITQPRQVPQPFEPARTVPVEPIREPQLAPLRK